MTLCRGWVVVAHKPLPDRALLLRLLSKRLHYLSLTALSFRPIVCKHMNTIYRPNGANDRTVQHLAGALRSLRKGCSSTANLTHAFSTLLVAGRRLSLFMQELSAELHRNGLLLLPVRLDPSKEIFEC